MVVEGAAFGEKGREEPFDVGYADCQCLDVLALIGQIAADVRRVSTNFRPAVSTSALTSFPTNP